MNQRERTWDLVQALMRLRELGTKAVGVGVRGGVRIRGVPRFKATKTAVGVNCAGGVEDAQ